LGCQCRRAHGAGINKLRDQLGVKVDVSDHVDEREREQEKEKGRSSKIPSQGIKFLIYLRLFLLLLDYWTKRER